MNLAKMINNLKNQNKNLNKKYARINIMSIKSNTQAYKFKFLSIQNDPQNFL